jgi:hypothetical protein
MAKIAVAFRGGVYGLHIWMADEEVDLVFDGTEWQGEEEIDLWPLTVRMRFGALPETAWAITVKRGGRTALDHRAKSRKLVVEKKWLVADDSTTVIADSELNSAQGQLAP